jgi:hypothetical protein
LTRDVCRLGLEKLAALPAQSLEENARLRKESAALCEEIARLRSLKRRPDPIGASARRQHQHKAA